MTNRVLYGILLKQCCQGNVPEAKVTAKTVRTIQGNSSAGRAAVSKTACRGFESFFPCQFSGNARKSYQIIRGFSSFGRARPCQGRGGGFEPRNPLQRQCAAAKHKNVCVNNSRCANRFDRIVPSAFDSRRVSSAGRASALQAEGHRFEPCTLHHYGPVVQLVRTPACHAGGRGFEPHPDRHFI